MRATSTLNGTIAPLISTLLYGVHPIDPAAFLAVPLILMVVALLASYIPARRAARVNQSSPCAKVGNRTIQDLRASP